MPYYNKKEYPKQIWVSQIPEREVSLLRENLAGIKQTTFVLMKKEEAFHQLSEKRSRDIIFLSSNQSLLDLARDVDTLSYYNMANLFSLLIVMHKTTGI